MTLQVSTQLNLQPAADTGKPRSQARVHNCSMLVSGCCKGNTVLLALIPCHAAAAMHACLQLLTQQHPGLCVVRVSALLSLSFFAHPALCTPDCYTLCVSRFVAFTQHPGASWHAASPRCWACRSKSRSLRWGDRLCCRDERPCLCTAGRPTRVGLNRMSIGMLLRCCQACCHTCCLGCCCCCNTVVCCCALLTALGLGKRNTHFHGHGGRM